MQIRIALRNILPVLGLLFAMAVAMGGHHANEDLYMALCSGRDVAEGLLGQPDYWSFVTEGKIWINQGWLSGLIFYGSYRAFGALGPVLIKGLLLTLTLALCFWKCRRLGIETGVCLVALVIGLLSMAPQLSIIAQNFGLLCLILVSSFLTMPVSYGAIRKWGCLLVMLLWSNLHGSFMIGWVMIWIKVAAILVDSLARGYGPALFARGANEEGRSPTASVEAEPGLQVLDKGDYARELRGWIWVATGSLILMAFANPYGLENLIMPFRQAESGAWTKEVLFWSPLLTFSKTQGLVLYTGIRSAPFLIHLSIVALLLCIVLVLQGRKGIASFSIRSQSKSGEDMLTEVMISVFLVVLAFRFGRTILFTAPALIPLTGYLLEQFMGTERGTCRTGSPISKRNSARLLLFVQCFLTALAILWFRFETFLPYLPHNPFAGKEPLSERVSRPIFLAG